MLGIRSYHQTPLLLRDGDGGARAGAEFKKILFNAVTENDAMLRHPRDKAERLLRSNAAKDEGRLGGFAGEWLARYRFQGPAGSSVRLTA